LSDESAVLALLMQRALVRGLRSGA